MAVDGLGSDLAPTFKDPLASAPGARLKKSDPSPFRSRPIELLGLVKHVLGFVEV